MTDKPDSKPAPENESKSTSEAEEAARKAKRDEELFGDLEDEEIVETPESILAERDALREEKLRLADRLNSSQLDNLSLTKQLATQKEDFATAAARTQKQVEEQKEFAIEKFIKEFLPVLDTLELGINSIPKEQREADPKLDKVITGFEKVLSGQLTAVFNKFGIREINPKDEAFDPNKHEALSTADNPDVESDIVVKVAQKGYELNGRVIRPAKVIVNL